MSKAKGELLNKLQLPLRREPVELTPFRKQVLFGPMTCRWVYYNPKTRHQVAIVSMYSHGREFDEYIVSIPIEGMGGWHVICSSLAGAEKIVKSEFSLSGKLYNRLLRMPRFFLQGRLS